MYPGFLFAQQLLYKNNCCSFKAWLQLKKYKIVIEIPSDSLTAQQIVREASSQKNKINQDLFKN